jgi:hypothetical protein
MNRRGFTKVRKILRLGFKGYSLKGRFLGV